MHALHAYQSKLPGNFGMQGVVFGDPRTHANQFGEWRAPSKRDLLRQPPLRHAVKGAFQSGKNTVFLGKEGVFSNRGVSGGCQQVSATPFLLAVRALEF